MFERAEFGGAPSHFRREAEQMNTAPVPGGTRVQDPLRPFWESVQVQVETEWGIAASCDSCPPIPVRQRGLGTSFSTSEP